ncbi:MAG: endonuclease III [Thermoplasmatales archaeon]|jgi:endonuclease-3|nr:endonuclease III [Candidatus Thermoplasmatota archaeon]MCL6002382.1 endonuclease III [Candidatus Thermoplasmatota archaeon]MDA8056321.1 endonuclease III [Thermoplasmatales archaeon]
MDGNFILDRIEKMVDPHIAIWDDAFRILITGILSTRTKDEVTDRASLRLFCKFPAIEMLAMASPEIVRDLIKPVGFYKHKSHDIIDTSRMIMMKHNGRVPDTMEELLELPGVGRKVANIVLSEGVGKEGLAVDTHVQRISFRLGLSPSEKPEETEKILKKKFPRKRWNEVNSYFVEFGKQICKPITPSCNRCDLRQVCKYWREHENSS